VIPLALVILSVTSVLSTYRIIFGPTPEDRLVGLNLLASKITAVLVILAVDWQRVIYLDVALVYAILGYTSVIAITRFIRGRGFHR